MCKHYLQLYFYNNNFLYQKGFPLNENKSFLETTFVSENVFSNNICPHSKYMSKIKFSKSIYI